MSNWKDKVVVVTGGNAGLGKAIVDEFARQKATVVSLSRSDSQDSDQVSHVQGDVTKDDSVDQAIQSIVDKFGRIDVWVNNVGKSTRTSFEACSIDDYRELMELNFFTAVRCTKAAMPHLKQSSGSVVLIGSLAARTGWKHISPYVTSKHALSGFAHQLRLEGPANVHSLFVCPGPIRRDDSSTRYQQQASGLDDEAATPGAGVKISGIEPELLARKIREAVERRKSELVMPWKARVLFSVLQLSPRLGDWLLRKSS
jgi:NAD(P)-dependent dehydrogenase (short-subunit alcohol dehydrogenase family)